MTQYIDKDTLVAEIEKVINEINLDIIEDWRYRLQWERDIKVMKNILSLIDTLEVKEVDLEEEMDKEWNKCEPIDEGMGLEIASIEHEQFDNIAKHFFELGLKVQKGE